MMKGRSTLGRMAPTELGKTENYSAPAVTDHGGTGPTPLLAQIPTTYAGLRLDRALAKLFPQYSRHRLQIWLKEGQIRVDGELAEAKRAVNGGEHLELVPPPTPKTVAPRAQHLSLEVVYEDEDLIVIDKPAGLVVHPGAGVPDGTLLNALLAHAPALAAVPRAGIVHRLDKDTSGLLVVAKNVSAQAGLAAQLAARRMRRTYLAVVYGVPAASGTIDAPVGRDARARTRMAVTRRGKEARTRYRVLQGFGSAALVECRLETGRTHQIRVHFQFIGHPLIGDPVYRRGMRGAPAFERQALHATELVLRHPRDGKELCFRSPLPRDIRWLLAELRRGARADHP